MQDSTDKTPAKIPPRKIPAHTLISSEGDPGGAWYILLNGRVGVFKGNHKVSEFDKKGSVFGEISSILSKPRTATLIALEDSEVLCIEANLEQLVKHHPDIARKIIVHLAERLVKTTDALWVAMEAGDERPQHSSQPNT